MVNSYSKGYRAEHGLVHELSKRGYMVIRSPRSGRIGLASPDVIAAKSGRLLAIECKSITNAFSVKQDQLDQLKTWVDVAGAEAFVAWKIYRKGWHFFRLQDVIDNNGNMNKKFAASKAMSIDQI